MIETHNAVCECANTKRTVYICNAKDIAKTIKCDEQVKLATVAKYMYFANEINFFFSI